jgi:hypothetical protein
VLIEEALRNLVWIGKCRFQRSASCIVAVMASVITRTLTAEGDGLAEIRSELGYTPAALERGAGLTRGVVSAVERGRLYAFPKFRRSVVDFLAQETGEDFAELHARLFPGYELPPPDPTSDMRGSGLDPEAA